VIVVDTSAWVDHFRQKEPELSRIIADEGVALHPYVWGELLLGGMPSGGEVAEQLEILPCPPVASASEAAAFIAWASLAGTGVGYVDAHLLVSAKLVANGRVLTRDKRLHAEAERLGLAYQP
jgi:predicted nucleic acid-binding protein